MWAPYTIWQAVLKGQVILRQKAYFGPDYYGRHFLIWCASFNRKISFSSLNFREGEAILPKCLSKGIVAQVSDNTSNISTLPAQHSWIWAKNKIPFNQVFPLHHTPSLESLQKSWVRKIFGLQPLGEKRKFCVTSFFYIIWPSRWDIWVFWSQDRFLLCLAWSLHHCLEHPCCRWWRLLGGFPPQSFIRLSFANVPVFLPRARWVPGRYRLCSLFTFQCHLGHFLSRGVIQNYLQSTIFSKF